MTLDESDFGTHIDVTPGEFSSFELLLMVTHGYTREEAAAYIAEHDRIQAKAARIQNLPISEWPKFEVQWDLDRGSFHYALDGASRDHMDSDELTVRWVKIAELDGTLKRYWHRTIEETWTVGSPEKVARVIVHCSEGCKLTPPWIAPNGSSINIVGGNHRLAVCRAKGLQEVPVLVRITDVPPLSILLPKWRTAT